MGKAPVSSRVCNYCGQPSLQLVIVDITKGIQVAFPEVTNGEKRIMCPQCLTTADWTKNRRRPRNIFTVSKGETYENIGESSPLFDQ